MIPTWTLIVVLLIGAGGDGKTPDFDLLMIDGYRSEAACEEGWAKLKAITAPLPNQPVSWACVEDFAMPAAPRDEKET